ncbi:heme ABC exporter ATP-binding protein CcmA [Enterococcus olivae]
MTNYLTIRDLSLSFGEKKILNNVSFDVQKGEFVTLLGPSGCGKSTLLRCIAGLEQPQEGVIELDDKEIQAQPTKDRDIGFVFQQYALFPTMTVFENVAFGLKVKKLSKEELNQRVFNLLDLVQLTEFSSVNVQRLSGGQKQRVALARALATEPKILLLDEPLSALDAKIRKQLQKDLRRIQRELNMTMIFVTHDQEEAMLISDRVFVLEAGEIVQASSPFELYTAPASPFVADFIGNNICFEWFELEEYTADFSKMGNQYLYYIRPELISMEPLQGAFRVPVSLKNVVTLGNIRRYHFQTSNGKEIVVDRLNDWHEIPETKALYIDTEDVIVVDAKKAANA